MDNTYLFVIIGIIVFIIIILVLLKNSAPLPYPATGNGEMVSRDLYTNVLAQGELAKIALHDKELQVIPPPRLKFQWCNVRHPPAPLGWAPL